MEAKAVKNASSLLQFSGHSEHCNSFIWTTSNVQISKLQRVQNASARLIMDIPKFPHVTPGLYELHTLPIAYWIKFKILVLPFKSIHGLGPSYF